MRGYPGYSKMLENSLAPRAQHKTLLGSLQHSSDSHLVPQNEKPILLLTLWSSSSSLWAVPHTEGWLEKLDQRWISAPW